MELSKKEIQSFKYDPFDPTTVKKLENEFPEFKADFGKVDKQKIICYLILCYDLNSTLVKQCSDITERKGKCADIAKFPKTKEGFFKKEYEEIIVGDNKNFNETIFPYMSSFGSPKFIAWNMYWMGLADEYKNMTTTVESDKRKIIIANTKILLADIDKLTQELFNGDEVPNIKNALYKGMIKKFRAITPEFIASATPEEIEEEIKSPYGNYKPRELKFVGSK
jgi:hypothetical protein